MAAYVISDVKIDEPELANRYRELAAASIAQYGGRYLARGGAIDVLEGGWQPATLIIVEFPDRASARAWYASPEYAEAIGLRYLAMVRNLILIDGVPEPL